MTSPAHRDGRAYSFARLVICGVAGVASLARAGAAAAQARTPINIYRFVLDVDVPESPALVAMDVSPTRALRGTAPKPLAAHVLTDARGGDAAPAVAIDFAPYFAAGGGVRTLGSYRSNSVEGRLKRVATKTLLSFAAMRDPARAGSSRLGLALRSTLHDPHDPIVNSRLPEQVDSALARDRGAAARAADEDVTDRGVDLAPLFAAARRGMRRRPGVKVSGGWGVSGELRGNVARADSLRGLRHSLWLSTQYTFGPRYDLLVTAGSRNAFRHDAYGRYALGVQRKTTDVDLRGELSYDSRHGGLNPAVVLEARPLPRTGVSAFATTERPPAASQAPARLRFGIGLTWYLARTG